MASEQDDRASAWHLSASQQVECFARADRELVLQVVRRLMHDAPVVPRIGDEELHDRRSAVPCLERDPTTNGLEITQARLGLHGYPPPGPLDHGVPGPLITDVAERHLISDSMARRQSDPQSPKQLELCGIADGRAVREGANRHIECERRPDRDQVLVGNMGARPRSTRLSSAIEIQTVDDISRSVMAARSLASRKSSPSDTRLRRANRRARTARRS